MATITVNKDTIYFPATAYSETVTVTCSDSNWSVSTGSAWCSASKINNQTLRISIPNNSGDRRSTTISCINGSNRVYIYIYQSISFDRSSMIKLYTQEPNVCAATCCCMVVKHSLDDVRKKSEEIDGKGADWITLANWSKIASAYGYAITDPSNYLCADPSSGTIVSLNTAVRYNEVSSYIIFQ